jgi:AcrR family transcriptional regulator
MSAPQNTTATRSDAITDAATRVFLRYGFKKTSMDDIARAADISRQGLYLHFTTKEALFKAALERMVSQMQQAAQDALDRGDLTVEQRLVTAFEALHGHAVGTAGDENTNELLAAAATLAGPLLHQMNQDLVTAVAALLTDNGVAGRWQHSGISARDLAEHLHATSSGAKNNTTTPEQYRALMRTAVRIVISAAGPHAGTPDDPTDHQTPE